MGNRGIVFLEQGQKTPARELLSTAAKILEPLSERDS
jgi:hypothetical protein